jgi:uncharacterized protein YaaW (UPF0174 family)
MPYQDRLFQLLEALDTSELNSIWEAALRRKTSDEEFGVVSKELQIALISAEWRTVHGHSVRNMWRGSHELPWKRILIDVADKLKPGFGWTPHRMDDSITEPALEQEILGYFDERFRAAWEAMSESERQKLVDQLNAEAKVADQMVNRHALQAGLRGLTVTSLSAGIGAGLLSGAGALALAGGSGSFALGGLLGGSLYRLGLWLVVRVFGMLSGAQLVASGGAAAVGGALLSAPAAAAFLANAVMSTSYRKTIPATLMLLTVHELRRQVAQAEVHA